MMMLLLLLFELLLLVSWAPRVKALKANDVACCAFLNLGYRDAKICCSARALLFYLLLAPFDANCNGSMLAKA